MWNLVLGFASLRAMVNAVSYRHRVHSNSRLKEVLPLIFRLLTIGGRAGRWAGGRPAGLAEDDDQDEDQEGDRTVEDDGHQCSS